jgi:hypothetical protein
MVTHWLPEDHWSVSIPLDTPHARLDVLAERGHVVLEPIAGAFPEPEWRDLQFMDWKSGGETRFAPIATATGELDCRGFWQEGDERPDKGARLTSNARRCPTIVRWLEGVAADYGRVRVIELEPQDHEATKRQLHRDDNNRFNPPDEGWVVRCFLNLTDDPDSYMLLMDSCPDGLPDEATEMRLPLPAGACVVVDTQRLWHAVCHAGPEPRYALISSFESGPALDAWIAAHSLNFGAAGIPPR